MRNRLPVQIGAVVACAAVALPAAAGPSPSSSDLLWGTETTRVSVSTSGEQGDWYSADPAITAHGRYVAFWSRASAMVADDTNDNFDVFVRDRLHNVTERVSLGAGESQSTGDGYINEPPSVSARGRFVTWDSRAPDLVAGDTNRTWDVFVRDREREVTERVSVTSDGAQAADPSEAPEISSHGRYVTFASGAHLAAADTNDATDIYVHDRVLDTTKRVSVGVAGKPANSSSSRPVISARGRYVAFSSCASNLVPRDTNRQCDVFVRDRKRRVTQRVSIDTGGEQADRSSNNPRISTDGRYVAFGSTATNLDPRSPQGRYHPTQCYLRDRLLGTTRLVSVAANGRAAGNDETYWCQVSADGRRVAFMSYADNLLPDHKDWGGVDAFVRDRPTGQTRLASVSSPPTSQADYGVNGLALSADGRHLALESDSTNLVPGDTNEYGDIFVRE